MKELLDQLNARFEAEGGIEISAYHSVEMTKTTPASGLGGGLPVEYQITLCGYPEGSDPFEFGLQALGQGETFEDALKDLQVQFAKKQSHE